MPYQIFWPKDLLVSQPHQLAVTQPIVQQFVLGVPANHKTYVVIATISQDELAKTEIPFLTASDPNNAPTITVLGPIISNDNIVQTSSPPPQQQGFLRFHISRTLIDCENCNIILYEPPNLHRMEFYSVQPISDPLFPKPENQEEQTNKMSTLVQSHDNLSFAHQREMDLNRSIAVINQCWILRNALISEHQHISKSWLSPSLSFNQIPGLICNFFSSMSFITWLHRLVLAPVLRLICNVLILRIRALLLLVIDLLNYRITTNAPSLIEISATAQQLDLRLQQLVHLPVQYFETVHCSQHSPRPQKNAEYIRLYNTLWLIINDVMIGYAVGTSFIQNRDIIVNFFTKTIFMDLFYSDLNKLSIWLMNSPGGVKLNNELSAFLSDLFRWILEFWRIALIQPILSPSAKSVALFFGVCCSIGGLTLGISMVIDIIHITTFHLYCFYYAMARIYNWSLEILLSLFYLFYGRKRNVLRDRVDSMEYELDEILLGILLFTVLLFLLPTVAAFYFSFTMAQMGIMAVIATLEVTMSLMNHSPIFVILLRLKEPKRVPNGVEFEMNSKLRHIELHSTPLTSTNIFSSFSRIIKSLPKSYFSYSEASGPTNSRYGLLKGLPVIIKRNKLYNLLYRNLPPKPVDTVTLLLQYKAYRRHYSN
ncbi:hypothetical protein WICPIJ_009548 [Wickerhamomyces pijperi]|uniref:Uncharacterized protein n=1 Tax=Wickerhamomyces pijperi TaxID=599730 RepID=A0A9P8TDH6_WICPI|nr:hypothetical protein WICPIJ_009548 [Wickerhamomyces pijperi]